MLSIRKTDQKADYGAIPDIKAAWARLSAAIMEDDKAKAGEALSVFRRTVLVSPDLISRDRHLLIKKAKDRVDQAFSQGPAPVGRKATSTKTAIELSDLKLY